MRCDLIHGGGRINWQCAKYGRWSDNPVPAKAIPKRIGRRIAGKITDQIGD